jgi:phosphoribosylanthranilate isomerase
MPAPSSPTEETGGAPAGDGATHVKVCGITEPAEISVLAERGVDFVGLWYGVPGGPADLPLGEWRELGAAAASTESLAPVLVTFLKDVDALRDALEGSGVHWVQLHGYQTPGVVRAVKEISPDIRVLKVLHVRGDDCVEAPLIGSYEKAGVDVFLFDAVAADGRVGSTGETLDPAVVAALAEQISRPFLLAGGLSDDNRGDYEALTRHPHFLGIDVDTNARGADGKVSADRVEAILRAWRAEEQRNA